MTLALFQETLKTLFMSPEGQHALESDKNFQTFVKNTALSSPEKETLLVQPLERLRQYEYMLKANVSETLQSIFPFTVELLGDQKEAVITSYFWQHPPLSYRLMAVGEAFPAFLQTQTACMEKYPFLAELALYEWAEAELLSAPNPNCPDERMEVVPQTLAELEAMIPVLNPVSQLLVLQYPIPALVEWLQNQSPETIPAHLLAPAQGTPVWVYRNNGPYHCRFFELNALLACWLNQLSDSPETRSYYETAEAVYAQLVEAQAGIQPEVFYPAFLGILPQLLEKGILLGSISQKSL